MTTIEITGLCFGILMLGFGIGWNLAFYIAIKKRIEESEGDAVMALWDDLEGNQWVTFILPDEKFYVYRNGQNMEKVITKNPKRRW